MLFYSIFLLFSLWHIQCARPKTSNIYFPNLQSYNFHLIFALWTPAPHHLYKFLLMLTSSSCVIFNQRKLLNALEFLVALQCWTESNQAGGRTEREGIRPNSRQHNNLLQRGQERSRREKSPGYRMWEISVHPHKYERQQWGCKTWNTKLSSLTKSIFPFMVP